ncbi:YnbE-like lipoprotein [Enhydrobacter aerosaccus]|uniref:YnbE-like lipoprotein n=1 Tax=Enhydrobacter aerosaccus TaxID=225324 RepID=A0A1T4SAJ0_9HYPH|nr:YnbE family lipoprotein [Enhydrobacter aerosaccus]SKA25233.1 YnbE-like lipoprotein [Enhydrobacter aerosaccus]
MRPGSSHLRRPLAALLAGSVAAACTPKVEVVAPKEPITINLNIKLDADVRLRVEKEATNDVRNKPIF